MYIVIVYFLLCCLHLIETNIRDLKFHTANFAPQVYNVLPPQNLSAYNTRLFKKESEGKRCYEVRLASAVKKGEEIKKKKDRIPNFFNL